MIIVDGKSEIIWAAESDEHPSKEGILSAAIGYCNQAGRHSLQIRIHQSATKRLYGGLYGGFSASPNSLQTNFSNAYMSPMAPVVLIISAPAFFS